MTSNRKKQQILLEEDWIDRYKYNTCTSICQDRHYCTANSTGPIGAERNCRSKLKARWRHWDFYISYLLEDINKSPCKVTYCIQSVKKTKQNIKWRLMMLWDLLSVNIYNCLNKSRHYTLSTVLTFINKVAKQMWTNYRLKRQKKVFSFIEQFCPASELKAYSQNTSKNPLTQSSGLHTYSTFQCIKTQVENRIHKYTMKNRNRFYTSRLLKWPCWQDWAQLFSLRTISKRSAFV